MRRIGLALLIGIAVAVVPPVLFPRLGWGPDASTLPPPARSVPIGGGLHLNVLELGPADSPDPPVVLVHGLPSDIADWAALPERLADQGDRVIVYDRIGYGWSSRTSEAGDAYTFASSARELGQLLDALHVPRAVLVGWSYGGGVVLTLAADDPSRVARLVLVGSVGPAYRVDPADLTDRLARTEIGPPLFRWVGSVPPISQLLVNASLASVFAGTRNVPPGWSDRTQAQLALPGTLEAFVTESRRMDVSSLHPEEVEAPTLVIQGGDDRSVPPAVAEDLARRLLHAKLLPVDHGSHMLPVTHTDLLADRIHAWAAAR
jgi:pimeloyl-ACP methyl ester carboxylesterase